MTWNEVIIKIALGLVPIILTLAGALVSVLIKKLQTKTSNDTFDHYYIMFNDLVNRVVDELEQTMVKSLKLKSADGKLTAEEGLAVLKEAKYKIANQLPPEAYKVISKVFLDVDALITTTVESKVKRQRW